MSTTPTTKTRQQLYDAVWTTPMVHLAKTYEINSYRLVKLCEEHDIPRPGNDYWPLLRLGYQVERTPLPPKSTAASDDHIFIAPPARVRTKPVRPDNPAPRLPTAPDSKESPEAEREMGELRQLSDLDRRELYKLIWSAPATRIATKFGISDVALAKRCKKLDVPRPSRGYWAKQAAGGNPRKKPLPPPPAEVFAKMARKRVGRSLPLPSNTDQLHPLAAEIPKALSKGYLDSYKRNSLRTQTLPELTVSKSLGFRVAQAFHVIISALEPLGILYRKSLSSYGPGFFRRGHDRLFIEISEALLDADGGYRPMPDWQRRDYGSRISGRLKFLIKSADYGAPDAQEWVEGPKLPLEVVLARVVTAIQLHFVEAQEKRVQAEIEAKKQHLEWERRHQEWLVEEAHCLQKEREQKHAAALVTTRQTRMDDLLKAAEWWRLTRNLMEFVNECEQRWLASSKELTAEQRAWVTWARQYSQSFSPFEAGYPDVTRDGAFDPEAVSFGGPYPATRNFPLPPTMPKFPPHAAT